MVGDWTKAFGGALGCVQDKKWKEGEKARGGNKKDNELLDDAPLKRVLPRIMVDGRVFPSHLFYQARCTS